MEATNIDHMIGRYPISVCLAIAMHLVWSIGIFLDVTAVNSTATHTMLLAVGPLTAGIIFGAVALIALAGLIVDHAMVRFVMLLPQQMVLWFSLVGATHAMVIGTFADGTVRTPAFLIVDQIPVVLIALGHTAAMLLIAREQLAAHARH